MQFFNIILIINLFLFHLFSINSQAKKIIGNLQLITPFFIKENKSYYKNDIDIAEQSIIQGHLISCKLAKIRLLNYNLGINIYIKLFINEEFYYKNNITITLKKCKKDSQNPFSPLHMALIFIKQDNNFFYEGWIFSQNSAFALPKIDNKFIYLTNCEN